MTANVPTGDHGGSERPDRPAHGGDPGPTDGTAVLRQDRRRSTVTGVVLLVVAVVLTVSVLLDPVDPWFQGLDDRALEWSERHRASPFVGIAESLDVAGSVAVTLPLRLGAIAVLLLRRRFVQLTIFVIAIVVSELCIGPLKQLVGRARPPASLVETSSPSFPSGHAIAAAVTSFGLVIAFLPRGRRRLAWIAVAATVAASMAWSRVYLGAHWASDTVAGTCIGVGVALLTEVIVTVRRERSAPRRARDDHAVPDTTSPHPPPP